MQEAGPAERELHLVQVAELGALVVMPQEGVQILLGQGAVTVGAVPVCSQLSCSEEWRWRGWVVLGRDVEVFEAEHLKGGQEGFDKVAHVQRVDVECLEHQGCERRHCEGVQG